jgi:hypothetical protein
MSKLMSKRVATVWTPADGLETLRHGFFQKIVGLR